MEFGKSDFFALFPMVTFHFDCSVLFIVCSRFDRTSFSRGFETVPEPLSRSLNVCTFYIWIIQCNGIQFDKVKKIRTNEQNIAKKEYTFVYLFVCFTVFNLPFGQCIPPEMDSLNKCQCEASGCCVQIIHISDWFAHKTSTNKYVQIWLNQSIGLELKIKLNFTTLTCYHQFCEFDN